MIHVAEPGLLTTVQDLGRHGHAHLGVPSAGAADTLSLMLANRLLGNDDDCAALEITLKGPTLTFEQDTDISLTGAAIDARLDGDWLAAGQVQSVQAGQRLQLRETQGGLRSYLAVAGGIRCRKILGSRSCDTAAGLGPTPLKKGTRLAIGKRRSKARYLKHSPDHSSKVIRFLPGPQHQWFDANAQAQLQQPYRVDSASDRSGLRLKGAAINAKSPQQVASQGMVTGAIQLPSDGQPIILLPNHGTTGGYPVIGVVIRTDLPRVAQALPGQTLRLQQVTPEEAAQAWQQQQTFLKDAIVPADTQLLALRQLLLGFGGSDLSGELHLNLAQQRLRLKK